MCVIVLILLSRERIWAIEFILTPMNAKLRTHPQTFFDCVCECVNAWKLLNFDACTQTYRTWEQFCRVSVMLISFMLCFHIYAFRLTMHSLLLAGKQTNSNNNNNWEKNTYKCEFIKSLCHERIKTYPETVLIRSGQWHCLFKRFATNSYWTMRNLWRLIRMEIIWQIVIM